MYTTKFEEKKLIYLVSDISHAIVEGPNIKLAANCHHFDIFQWSGHVNGLACDSKQNVWARTKALCQVAWRRKTSSLPREPLLEEANTISNFFAKFMSFVNAST